MNWRRVRLPAGWGLNLCSWGACTATYTSHRMPRLTSAGPWTRLAVGVVVLAVALTSSLPGETAHAAKDVLRYLGGDVKTLDPAFIGDASDVQLLLQLYAGLTRLDESGTPYPSLASSWDVGVLREVPGCCATGAPLRHLKHPEQAPQRTSAHLCAPLSTSAHL